LACHTVCHGDKARYLFAAGVIDSKMQWVIENSGKVLVVGGKAMEQVFEYITISKRFDARAVSQFFNSAETPYMLFASSLCTQQ
jgi:hypothetical protein